MTRGTSTDRRPKPWGGPVPYCLLLALLLVASPSAAADDLQVANRALEAEAVKSLEALAKWCIKKRLFGKRDEAYERILAYDPEHATAREKLRYKKGEDGGWVQDPRYKRPANWKRSAAKEYDTRLAEWEAKHHTAVLALCAQADTITNLLWARRRLAEFAGRYPGDERPASIGRDLGLRYYVATRDAGVVAEMAEAGNELRNLYPEDLEVRMTLGDVKHEDRWVMGEVARTLAGASKLAETADGALEKAKATEEAKLEAREKKIELPWSTGVATPNVRAIGTVEDKHLKSVAVSCEAALAVFQAALDVEPVRREGLTFYVFKEKGEIETFIAGYPVVDNPYLRMRKKLKLALVPVDSGGHAIDALMAAGQLELAVNMTLNLALQDTFLASANPKGWHAEGITRYLAFKLLGTRFVISVTGDYAGQGGDRKVPESYESWLARAHALVAKTPDVGLALLLGKGVDVFQARDSVIAYAFAAYLIEGHDRLAVPFLRTLWTNADVDRTCREILGLPLAVVEYRFKAWLAAMTAVPASDTPKKKDPPKKAEPK